MPREAKITPEQLRAELASGANQEQIAAKYGMDRGNVSRAIKRLKGQPPTVSALRVIPATRSKASKTGLPADADELSMWDTKAALDRNYAGVRELLDRKKYPFTDSKTKVRIHAEIRAHIAEGVRIMETLYAIQEHRAFQSLILEILDEFEPGTRERVLDRMRQRRALRRAVPDG